MSVDSNYKLNASNFFHYYLFNPLSKNLNKCDRIKALIGTICLGFSLGVGHVVCRLFFYDKKVTLGKNLKSSSKTSSIGKSAISKENLTHVKSQLVKSNEKEIKQGHRIDKIFTENEVKVEEFKSLSSQEKINRCAGLSLEEIYNLQQMFCELDEKISVFPYLNAEKIQEWDFEKYNPLKNSPLQIIFPDKEIGKYFTVKQVIFFCNNLSLNQVKYLTCHIPLKTIKELDFKLLKKTRSDWNHEDKEKVTAILYGNRETAKEKIGALNFEQVNYVLDLFEDEDLYTITNEIFKKIKFGFIKNTFIYSILFPFKNEMTFYYDCEKYLSELAKKRIDLLSQEQFNDLEKLSKEKPEHGRTYFNDQLLNYIKEKRNFVSQSV